MAAAAASSTTTSSSLAAVLLYAAAFFFVATAASHAKTDDGDLVARTCASVISHDWGPFEFDRAFCESTLRLDKRSAAAKHPRDLALIAMDLTQRAVADADAKLDAAAHGIDGDAALTLRYTRLDYAAAASAIPVCRALAEGYKPGGQQLVAPGDHFECARRLRRHTFSCWLNVAWEYKLAKLVLKEVVEASQRADLVDAMLEEMLGVVINDHNPTLWF